MCVKIVLMQVGYLTQLGEAPNVNPTPASALSSRQPVAEGLGLGSDGSPSSAGNRPPGGGGSSGGANAGGSGGGGGGCMSEEDALQARLDNLRKE